MISVRSLSLRTQLVIVVAIFAVFALGAAVSGLIASQAQSSLSTTFNNDLAIYTKLPRLKALLRKLDLATYEYLKSGDESSLKEHREIIEQIKRTEDELFKVLPLESEKAVLTRLDRQLTQHFMDESRWIRRKRSGSLLPPEAEAIISARRSYEEILETALGMHDVNVAEFPVRIDAASRAGNFRFMLLLCIGLLASATIAVGLSYFIIEPIRLLSDYAGRWRPGEPWNCRMPMVSPEIRTLFEQMQRLIGDLNREYKREKDMGQLKSDLVSMVSHELNNALTVIHAASTSLEDSEPKSSSEKRGKLYRIIKGQTFSLSRAVTNLLNMGRLESGKLSLSKKKIDIPTTLQRSLDLMEVLYQNKEQRVSLNLPNRPLHVYADPEALTLVITNLLNNAIKYTPNGGSILIGCEQDRVESAFVRIYIEDTGIGISSEEKEKIFSAYYRSERGKSVAKGFGIGLALTRSIVEAHGGLLELESQVGKGSRFSFLLPIWIDDFKVQENREAQLAEDPKTIKSGLALSGG